MDRNYDSACRLLMATGDPEIVRLATQALTGIQDKRQGRYNRAAELFLSEIADTTQDEREIVAAFVREAPKERK